MAGEPPTTFYDLLQLPRNATVDEVRAAYRRLAREHHPDRAGASGETMAGINQAYEVLSDPERRARYDHGLAHRPTPRQPGRVALPGDRTRSRAIWAASAVAVVLLAGAGAMLGVSSREAAAPRPTAQPAPVRPVTDEGLRLTPSRSIASWPPAGEKPAAGQASAR
jgi:hypothetical protein